ncbi:hypothetical protein AVEN_132715-1 [Araneus ventricosus]|uniref:Uncharacterized protein n=1 Tax=Araneus ventricosus TaxID=182803 RepID=A0A4Y2AUV4_ARAVE|nr:hypothetical protein AVEN_132715-1 [Araneus ventricosus]
MCRSAYQISLSIRGPFGYHWKGGYTISNFSFYVSLTVSGKFDEQPVNISAIDCPPNSLDSNTIDHLWDTMITEVKAYQSFTAKMVELHQTAENVWSSVILQPFDKLIVLCLSFHEARGQCASTTDKYP